MVELCRELAALLPPQLQKVILLNTGSEANEAAIRMAKLVSGGHEVVGLTASFHGLTGGAGAATYSVGRRGYGPAHARAAWRFPRPMPTAARSGTVPTHAICRASRSASS